MEITKTHYSYTKAEWALIGLFSRIYPIQNVAYEEYWWKDLQQIIDLCHQQRLQEQSEALANRLIQALESPRST